MQPTVTVQADAHRWIKRHPLVAFFGLAYAISWGIWSLQPSLQQIDPTLARTLDTLGPYGPTLSALLLSAVLKPGLLSNTRPWSRIAATVLILMAAVWVLAEVWIEALRSQQLVGTVIALALITALPAWLVWCGWSSQRGIRELIAPLLSWRISWRWYLVAFLLFPLTTLAGLLLLPLFGQAMPAWFHAEAWSSGSLLLFNVFVATAFYGGPFGEEAGWRGFALPRLQARYSPLMASVILGLLWGFWHFPLHFRGMYDTSLGAGVVGLLLRMGSGVTLSIIFTWLYNRSHGNLLLMVLLHTVINNTFGFWLPVHASVYVVVTALVVVLVFWDEMASHLIPVHAESDGHALGVGERVTVN